MPEWQVQLSRLRQDISQHSKCCRFRIIDNIALVQECKHAPHVVEQPSLQACIAMACGMYTSHTGLDLQSEQWPIALYLRSLCLYVPKDHTNKQRMHE